MSMAPREIRNRQGSRYLADLLQTIFAVELLAPSERIWLVSPWLTDIPILDNTAGQFSALAPEWERVKIRLSQVLIHLGERGSIVHVATRDEVRNMAFHNALQKACRRLPGQLFSHIDLTNRLHEKGLLGDSYYLEGSVNFTMSGITLNEEKALFHTDPTSISENRIFLRDRWREPTR